MAHYALIDENNLVVAVITGVDEDVTQIDVDGSTVGGSSEAWEDFYASRSWYSGLTCKRTSYNGRIRKHYAGIGFTYDPVADVFIPPQPFPSWTLNNDYQWEAPKIYPDDGNLYKWSESQQKWISLDS